MAAFVLIFVFALLFGHAGFLSPRPTPSPTPSPSPVPTASPTPSPSAVGHAVAVGISVIFGRTSVSVGRPQLVTNGFTQLGFGP